MNIETTRARFEDMAFNQRYIMSIRKVSDNHPMGLNLQSVDCPTKVEFVKRRPDDEESYVDQTLNIMWFSWKAAYTRLTMATPQNVMVALSKIREQYGKQPICCGNFQSGYGGDGMLEPPDPPTCCGEPEETVDILLDEVFEGILRFLLPVPGPELKDDAPAELLWAEIHRLRAAVQGPSGFDTWQDAATDERIQRVRAERTILALRAELTEKTSDRSAS